MSELQPDVVMNEYDEPVEQEVEQDEGTETSQVEDSELAPDSPDEGEENTKEEEDDNSPEWFQKKINKQTFKQRQAERERDEARKEAEELRRKYESAELKPVDVPPIPDTWDDNYEQKIRQRDEAILQKAKYEATQAQRREQSALSEQQEQRKQYERSQALNDQFVANSKKLGVDTKALSEAQDVILQAGVTPQLAVALLEDADGPLMVQHLAANPMDLYDILDADPLRQGYMLASVKTKASALKRKSSSAPNPATTLNGRAAPPKQRGPSGATFE